MTKLGEHAVVLGASMGGLLAARVRRLKRLLIKKRGRNLRAGQADQWTEEWLTGTACIGFVAPSVTPGLRNHV
jgi:hypothetical protein